MHKYHACTQVIYFSIIILIVLYNAIHLILIIALINLPTMKYIMQNNLYNIYDFY